MLHTHHLIFAVVQSLSRVWLFCDLMDCSMPGFPVLHFLFSLLILMSIESMMPASHLILSGPLLLLSICPSIRLFSSESVLRIRWQRIGASASASDLSMTIRGWLPLGLTGLISLLSKRLSRVFFSTTVQKHQFFGSQPSLWANSHIHRGLLEKP